MFIKPVCPVRFLLRSILSALLLGGSVQPGAAQTHNHEQERFDIVAAAVCGVPIEGSAGVFDVKIAVDTEGNSYLTGTFTGVVRFGDVVLRGDVSAGGDVFVAKRSAAGSWLWAVHGGGAGTKSSADIAVDNRGGVWIAGSFEGREAHFDRFVLSNASAVADGYRADVFVAKLDALTGAWRWATPAGGGDRFQGSDKAAALAVDGDGVYVAGTFTSPLLQLGSLALRNATPGHADVFVAALDAGTGTWQWAQRAGGLAGDEAADIAVDEARNLYVTGNFSSDAEFGTIRLKNAGYSGVFVGSLNGRTGAWRWATDGQRSGAAGTVRSTSIAVDGVESVFIAGDFSSEAAVFGPQRLANAGTAGSDGRYSNDAFLTRLRSTDGQWEWAVRSGGTGHDGYSTLATSGEHRVTVAGEVSASESPVTEVHGSSCEPVTFYSAGANDAVIAQYDGTSGTQLHQLTTGSNTTDRSNGIAVDGQGYVYLAGCFGGGSANLGDVHLTGSPGTGSYTSFMVRLGNPNASQAAGHHLAVWPNPTRYEFYVGDAAPNQRVELLDAVGRLVAQDQMPAAGLLRFTLPSALPAGVYVVRAGSKACRLLLD